MVYETIKFFVIYYNVLEYRKQKDFGKEVNLFRKVRIYGKIYKSGTASLWKFGF